MVRFTIGPKTEKGARSYLKEASADDPIYTRGFAIGGLHSTPSSSSTAEKDEETSNTKSSEDNSFDIAAHKSLEASLQRMFDPNMEHQWMEQNPSLESDTENPPEALSLPTSTVKE